MRCYTIYDDEGNIIAVSWVSEDQPQPLNSIEGEYNSNTHKIDINTKTIIEVE